MAYLSNIGTESVVADIFGWNPHAGQCIREWHQIVMRGPSPLSAGQRELIAAYTSSLNACELCFGVHRLVASRFGIDADLFDAIGDDIDSAPVDPQLRPLLRFARKLTIDPSKVVQADAQAVLDAGWSEQALHDAINVISMFNFMNRLVLGHGGTEGDIAPHFDAGAAHLANDGYFPD